MQACTRSGHAVRIVICVFLICSEFSRPPRVLSYVGTQLKVRRVDGSLVCRGMSPYPILLHEYASSARWDDALRLCRFAKVYFHSNCCVCVCVCGLNLNAHQLNQN